MDEKEELRKFLASMVSLAYQAIEAAEESGRRKQEDAEIMELEELVDCLKAKAICILNLPIRVTTYWIEITIDPKMVSILLKRRKRAYGLEDSAEDIARTLSLLTLLFPNTNECLRVPVLPPFDLRDEICRCILEWITECDVGSPTEWKNQVDLLRSGLITTCRKDCTGEFVAEQLLLLVKDCGIHESLVAVVLRMLVDLMIDSKSLKNLIGDGLVPLFAKILKEDPVEVRLEVTSVVSTILPTNPKWQDVFVKHHVIDLLVGYLMFDIDEDVFEDAIYINKATSVLSIVMATYNSRSRNATDDDNEQEEMSSMYKKIVSSLSVCSPFMKDRMKAMAASALGTLAKGNASICRMIAKTRAPMCFAVLLREKNLHLQTCSAMALMEITSVAEHDSDLRRSMFKHSTRAYKAIVDQLAKIIGANSGLWLLTLCIKAVGNMAKTFRDSQMVLLLLNHLDPLKGEVLMEALYALTQFVSRDNFLHKDHSKAIVNVAGAVTNLAFWVSFGDIEVQKRVLIILCHVGIDVPRSEEHARQNILSAINFASRKPCFATDKTLRSLVNEAKFRLE